MPLADSVAVQDVLGEIAGQLGMRVIEGPAELPLTPGRFSFLLNACMRAGVKRVVRCRRARVDFHRSGLLSNGPAAGSCSR
jgi:hypothetical protein